MNTRAAELIESLRLEAHPEGGWYREVFRSPTAAHGDRAAITTIYYLLADGGHSRWHRIESDEIWHWYEGAPLELIGVSETDWVPRRTVLGPAGADHTPVGAVPGGEWQAARTLGDYTLVGCSVAPGFQYSEFRLLADDAALAARLRQRLPSLASFI